MEIDVRREAVKLFNETWDLIDIKERTPEQEAQMLHKAHASRYLWGLVGESKNFSRGEWQVSRVYAELKMGAPALLHGKLSLDIAEKNNLEAHDLAFGHEAVARAYGLLGENDNAAAHKAKGLEAAATLANKEDREYAESEINNIVC